MVVVGLSSLLLPHYGCTIKGCEMQMVERTEHTKQKSIHPQYVIITNVGNVKMNQITEW